MCLLDKILITGLILVLLQYWTKCTNTYSGYELNQHWLINDILQWCALTLFSLTYLHIIYTYKVSYDDDPAKITYQGQAISCTSTVDQTPDYLIIVIIIIIISVMEMGHLLTHSGLTYPEVSWKVCNDSYYQLENSVSLSWVFWARNPFRGNFNHWQVSWKEAGQIFSRLFLFNITN
jgi:hypothetical protein